MRLFREWEKPADAQVLLNKVREKVHSIDPVQISFFTVLGFAGMRGKTRIGIY
jgi:hypothetical protein